MRHEPSCMKQIRTGYETGATMYETDYETRATTYEIDYETRATTYNTGKQQGEKQKGRTEQHRKLQSL